MKIDNRFSAEIAALAMPKGDNALSIIGKGLEKFVNDEYKTKIKDINLTKIMRQMHDDKLAAEYIAKKGGLSLGDGEQFLTASGANKAFNLDNALLNRERANRAESRAIESHNLSLKRIMQNMALANSREARAKAKFGLSMQTAKERLAQLRKRGTLIGKSSSTNSNNSNTATKTYFKPPSFVKQTTKTVVNTAPAPKSVNPKELFKKVDTAAKTIDFGEIKIKD